MKLGFVAVFRSENEVGIDKTFAVGYKGEICTEDYLILL